MALMVSVMLFSIDTLDLTSLGNRKDTITLIAEFVTTLLQSCHTPFQG